MFYWSFPFFPTCLFASCQRHPKMYTVLTLSFDLARCFPVSFSVGWRYKRCQKQTKTVSWSKTPDNDNEYTYNILHNDTICFALPQLGISLCVLCQVHLRIRSAHPGQRDSDCVESWRGCPRDRFCLDWLPWKAKAAIVLPCSTIFCFLVT